MFEFISTAPSDPILGLAELFQYDPRHNKINLGIGVYKNSNGDTPILNSVKKAEKYLLQNEYTKNYLSIEGLQDFCLSTKEILFGKNHNVIQEERTCTVQTLGGTGALRISADFIASQTSIKNVFISDPGWPNHKNIFQAAGLNVKEYKYFDNKNHSLDFDNMIDTLKTANRNDAVLFHGCCHNPTGVDPNIEQWNELAQLSKKNGWLPIFDIAYQGFARSLEEDVLGLHIFLKTNEELIIANSYSKNFGLYNDRIGALTIITKNKKIANIILTQLKNIIRSHYSNPPAHGAFIVHHILNDNILCDLWKKDLNEMRDRIKYMRKLFVNTLIKKGSQFNFNFITKQHGMFSYSGLTLKQIMILREKFSIYAVNSGRINIAGMTENNIPNICDAIIYVQSKC